MNNETFLEFSSGSSLVLEAGVDLKEKLVNSNSVILKSTVETSSGKKFIRFFFDDEKFVRSKTRMDKHLKFVFDNKNPLLLRSNSYFTKLIILRSHEKVFHSGLEATLGNIRMRYLITK